MAPGMNAFFVLTAGEPHKASVIAQIVLQGSLNPDLEEDRRRNLWLDATGSADQLIAGHLAGVIKLDQA